MRMKILPSRLWAVWLLAIMSFPLFAQQSRKEDSLFVVQHYDKQEHYITMRDGTKLFTSVCIPKDISPTNKYPILMQRTCYSVAPYGLDKMKLSLGPSGYLMRDKYIFVYQDVRGRYMSEGTFENMRPQIPANVKKKKTDIDESTDTYDTIDWLIKNIKNNNGKVGQWGISYPGFYAAVGALNGHPAMKASSPQAPIADFFFDDFHHHGAYFLSYFFATPVFGYQKDKPTDKAWYTMVNPGTPDGYQFFMDMGSLKNASNYYGDDNFFWKQLSEHPNYDEFWQKRNLLPHLKNIRHAVMTVGGWFDAEDLYGPLNIYKTIEKNNKGISNTIVMGPWSHGDWARNTPQQVVGNIYFGDSIADFYQKEIEMPFFKHHLKGSPNPKLPEAYMFDSGIKQWFKFNEWPVKNADKKRLYFHQNGQLSFEAPAEKEGYAEFVSDPAKPVPYVENIETVFTPRRYMTDDQRFAARRPDVLVFQTDVLEEDITLTGEMMANLKVAISGTDADWFVKLIDVYPADHPDHPYAPKHIKMGGYQQMVRSETFRGRFRNSYEKPEPFVPGQVTNVNFPLQDVLHTFKKGHRIMIQIQSTAFPLIDRNPQKYVDNIFKADDSDFIKAVHQVFCNSANASFLEVHVQKK